MTPSELQAIRERDAESGGLWFTGPASFTALAARDRRALLDELDRVTKERDAFSTTVHRAFNQFENITVSKSLDDAYSLAHAFIGWAYSELSGYTSDVASQEKPK